MGVSTHNQTQTSHSQWLLIVNGYATDITARPIRYDLKKNRIVYNVTVFQE